MNRCYVSVSGNANFINEDIQISKKDLMESFEALGEAIRLHLEAEVKYGRIPQV